MESQILETISHTAQKMKFSIKDILSKCDQICRKLSLRLKIFPHKITSPPSRHMSKLSKLYKEIENIQTEFAALKNSLTYVKPTIEEKPDLSTWENCLP